MASCANDGPSTAVITGNFAGDSYEPPESFQILGNLACVPEPASWALMIVGLSGLGAALRRSRQGGATVRG